MSLQELATSRAGQLVSNLLTAGLWLFFLARHLSAFLENRTPITLVFCLSESALVVLFLLRKPARDVAADWMPWALGIGGTLAPLLFDPTNVVLFAPGTVLTAIGALIMFGGIVSLNRSFGIVAARRDIKTGGLYQLVRHPIYASYVFSFTGYILGNWSVGNLLVWLVSLGLMLARVGAEEELLSKDEGYRAFKERTPYRLFPYIW